MEIRPEDLGEARWAGVIRLRGYATTLFNPLTPGAPAAAVEQGKATVAPVAVGASDNARKPGPLGRLWSRGAGLSDTAAQNTLASAGVKSAVFLSVFFGGILSFILLITASGVASEEGVRSPWVALFFALGVVVAWLGLRTPGVKFRRWARAPLTEAEANFLIEAEPETNGLERAFLALVRDAVRSSPPAGETEQTVRQALRALSDALAQLPPTTNHDALTVGASDWQAEAAALEAQAQAETDPVIAASLARRADALSRSATSASRSSLLVRRTQALRSELETQTHALRLGLASLQPGAHGSTAVTTNDVNGPAALADLSQLALAVQKVARETANIADARAELDGATGAGANSYRASGDAAVLRAGVR